MEAVLTGAKVFRKSQGWREGCTGNTYDTRLDLDGHVKRTLVLRLNKTKIKGGGHDYSQSMEKIFTVDLREKASRG